MKRRNRRKIQAGAVFPKSLILTIVAVVGLALAYLYVQIRTETVAREVKQLEAKRDQLRTKMVKEQCEWARMQSPASLERALRELGLVMAWPARSQIVRLRPDGSLDRTTSPDFHAPRTREARADRIVMND